MSNEFDNVYWNDLKIKLKKKYSNLTNADLQFRYGTQDDLLKMIAHKLGKTKKELQLVIEKF
ncbi:MAG: hypothetical protein A2W99_03670 [Bacteroidetes bacterium GWF2_33_16]|nr:MAG: hypothetical protein A2X00_11400 [Bacteroidetes bacterium GWE2_32_14]OFY08282.1 MAG: hypothetical protein A2W99_03670 [Bacteroidetes bacterium GWF2_33_16]